MKYIPLLIVFISVTVAADGPAFFHFDNCAGVLAEGGRRHALGQRSKQLTAEAVERLDSFYERTGRWDETIRDPQIYSGRLHHFMASDQSDPQTQARVSERIARIFSGKSRVSIPPCGSREVCVGIHALSIRGEENIRKWFQAADRFSKQFRNARRWNEILMTAVISGIAAGSFWAGQNIWFPFYFGFLAALSYGYKNVFPVPLFKFDLGERQWRSAVRRHPRNDSAWLFSQRVLDVQAQFTQLWKVPVADQRISFAEAEWQYPPRTDSFGNADSAEKNPNLDREPVPLIITQILEFENFGGRQPLPILTVVIQFQEAPPIHTIRKPDPEEETERAAIGGKTDPEPELPPGGLAPQPVGLVITD